MGKGDGKPIQCFLRSEANFIRRIPLQPFDQITDLTDVPEGTIVRCITRLDETCREVRDAARVIGDKELFTKMEEAQALIKRDSRSSFIFAATHEGRS